MKSATLALPLLLALGATASAYEWASPRMNCEWREIGAEARAGIDHANYLLGLPCEVARNAAVQSQFPRLDAKSLAAYNRGLNVLPYRQMSTPHQPAVGATLRTRPLRR